MDDEDISPFPFDEEYQNKEKKMPNVNYNWLKNFKGYEIVENGDHFLFIKKDGVPINVYSINQNITEDFLRQEIIKHGKLEKMCK